MLVEHILYGDNTWSRPEDSYDYVANLILPAIHPRHLAKISSVEFPFHAWKETRSSMDTCDYFRYRTRDSWAAPCPSFVPHSEEAGWERAIWKQNSDDLYDNKFFLVAHLCNVRNMAVDVSGLMDREEIDWPGRHSLSRALKVAVPYIKVFNLVEKFRTLRGAQLQSWVDELLRRTS